MSPRPSVDDLRTLFPVAQAFRWNVLFATFPPAVAAPPTSSALNLRCTSSTYPERPQQAQKLWVRGSSINSPSIIDYNGEITLNCVETVDNLVMLFLHAWEEAGWATNTGIQGSKPEIEATLLLQLLDNKDKPRWQEKLIGCWLKNITKGELTDGSGGEFFRPAMLLSYDRYESSPIN